MVHNRKQNAEAELIKVVMEYPDDDLDYRAC